MLRNKFELLFGESNERRPIVATKHAEGVGIESNHHAGQVLSLSPGAGESDEFLMAFVNAVKVADGDACAADDILDIFYVPDDDHVLLLRVEIVSGKRGKLREIRVVFKQLLHLWVSPFFDEGFQCLEPGLLFVRVGKTFGLLHVVVRLAHVL